MSVGWQVTEVASIKRIGHRYKYYLTELGRRAVITGLKLRELLVLPQLARRGPDGEGVAQPGEAMPALGLIYSTISRSSISKTSVASAGIFGGLPDLP